MIDPNHDEYLKSEKWKFELPNRSEWVELLWVSGAAIVIAFLVCAIGGSLIQYFH